MESEGFAAQPSLRPPGDAPSRIFAVRCPLVRRAGDMPGVSGIRYCEHAAAAAVVAIRFGIWSGLVGRGQSLLRKLDRRLGVRSKVAMNTTTPTATVEPCPAALDFSFKAEFSQATFRDRCLNDRAARFADGALRHPETSIPRMAGGSGGAEGLYRFIANPKVTVANVSQAHEQQTLLRCQEATGTILLVHDTTTFGYGKDTKRQGMGIIAGGGIGFLAHMRWPSPRNLTCLWGC